MAIYVNNDLDIIDISRHLVFLFAYDQFEKLCPHDFQVIQKYHP